MTSMVLLGVTSVISTVGITQISQMDHGLIIEKQNSEEVDDDRLVRSASFTNLEQLQLSDIGPRLFQAQVSGPFGLVTLFEWRVKDTEVIWAVGVFCGVYSPVRSFAVQSSHCHLFWPRWDIDGGQRAVRGLQKDADPTGIP